MFCQSCGTAIADNAIFCPSCGAPASGAVTMGATTAQRKPVQHVSAAWHLVPLFFGILGGIIAWAVNRDKDPSRARNMLIFGLVLTLVPIIVGLAVFFYAAPTIAPATYS